jgi:hypothetical protein
MSGATATIDPNSVFQLLETETKKVIHQKVAYDAFKLLETQILQILGRNPTQPLSNTKIATPLDRITPSSSRWNFQSGSSSGGFSGSIAKYGREAFQTIRNAFSTIFKPRTPIVPTTPFEFTPYTGSENIVQLEVQTRTGNNTINKLGLYGLKKLGDAFEPIQPSSADQPFKKFVPDSDETEQEQEQEV